MRQHSDVIAAEGAASRQRLVNRLLGEFDLRRVADTACAREGIVGWEEPLAYSLVVLVQKADHERTSSETGEAQRTYNLDPDAPDFRIRLSEWAAAVARHLARWGATYTAIQAEADNYDLSTLRGMIVTDRGDDLVDQIAEDIAALLGRAPRIEEMTLARLVEDGTVGNEYAFATPLLQWVRTIAGRRLGRLVASLEGRDDIVGGNVIDDVETARSNSLRAFQELIAVASMLAATQGLLNDALEQAQRTEEYLAKRTPTTEAGARALRVARSHFLYVVGDLLAEKQAVPGMLAYIAIGMRSSDQLQRVSVLSLRVERIDSAVVDAMTSGLRTVIEDPFQPVPALVKSAQRAVAAKRIPKSRATALTEISDDPATRRTQLEPVWERIAALPARVADIRAIGPVISSSYGVVKTQRSAATKELGAVNHRYAQVFTRYTVKKGDDDH